MTYATPFNPIDRSDHCSVVLNGKLLVAGGMGWIGHQILLNDVWSSTDGLVWENLNASPVFSGRSAMGCALHQSQVVLVGGYDGSLGNDVWITSTGSSWSLSGTGNFSGREYHGVVSFQDKLWVVGGWDGRDPNADLNDVWYSTTLSDGFSAATHSAGFPARRAFGLTAYHGKLWIAAGWGSGAPLQDVWIFVGLSE